MNAYNLSGRARDCPDVEELAAFSAGELPEAMLEQVAAHASRCDRCTSTLRALDGAEDTLRANLRLCVQPDPILDEPECGALEARAKAIPGDRPDEAGTVTADGAVTGTWHGAEPFAPERFGKFELLERLGKGGMGVVYKARQTEIDQVVALKMILAGAYAEPHDLERFRVEAAAVARLKHPNVIAFYEFDHYDGRPYFTMEYVAGGSLADRLASGVAFTQDDAAKLVETLARAMHAVHQVQVVHRDLKPANVLLGTDQIPRITDFGLAKLLDAQDGQTATGVVMGTASYMAFEQAMGKNKAINAATDVYALGAILYELLCGRPPFQGADRNETLKLVCSQEPMPPSRVRPGINRELEAVCLKCLEKRPSDRHASAEALADELGRRLRREPTLTYRHRWSQKLRHTIRRRPVACFVLLLALFVPLFVLAAVARLDPDRPVKEIERRLAKGEKVTLIGETGAPAWFHTRVGGKHTRQTMAPDGAFTIDSWDDLCLMELVRDPQSERYVITARVRHEKSNDHGEVGIYFGRREPPCEGIDMHTFFSLSYNDIHNLADFNNKRLPPAMKVLVKQPTSNTIYFSYHMYGRQADKRIADGHLRDWSRPEAFQPVGYQGGQGEQWRMLTVNVTADRIEASWEGMPLVVQVPTAGLATLADTQLAVMGIPRVAGAGVRQQFSSPQRGGLGIFVRESSASFSSVTVEPQ